MSKLDERYGGLVITSWAPLFEVALACRRELGIQPCEAELLTAILLSYREPGLWESVAQTTLASRLGISRSTVNHQIARLREKGMLAVSPDEARRRQPLWDAPLRYCVDPYLAVLARCAARRSREMNLALRLDREADQRFERFVNEVRLGRWDWHLGDLRSSSPEEVEKLARNFSERNGLRLRDAS